MFITRSLIVAKCFSNNLKRPLPHPATPMPNDVSNIFNVDFYALFSKIKTTDNMKQMLKEKFKDCFLLSQKRIRDVGSFFFPSSEKQLCMQSNLPIQKNQRIYILTSNLICTSK